MVLCCKHLLAMNALAASPTHTKVFSVSQVILYKDHVAHMGETPCPVDPWIVVLKLLENPEIKRISQLVRLPRNMLLSVDRQLVQTIVPGTRLTIMGIYSIFQASKTSTSHKGAVAIRQPYIRVVGIEETNEATCGPANFTQEEVEEFKRFAAEGNVYENICSKIAPSIFGHEDVKKVVACLLFGGSRKNLPDGVRLMGDISVLLLGDPSTAKSQREFYLEAGAMVLADGGVVCIDVHNKLIMNIKIISPVLDMIPMSLGINLAALAFRKELIDLAKRLSANLSTYRDTLFEECLRFLKEVEFGVRESSNQLHSPGNIWTIYAETTSVFFKGDYS
ncbi:unnamed protein product [Lactuca virosa]|uniref:MCM C-terminal AAA(+) ATPase domain-containing protein n=1 Tax=Lactuca virosa TaxID=75947 RepID=A0AAU9PWU7_9ASTR|nr:unnamed protein product [Lactuca virosa]